MDWVKVGSPHEFRVTMDDPGESLGKPGCFEVDHSLTPGGYHLILSQEERVFLEMAGGDLAGK